MQDKYPLTYLSLYDIIIIVLAFWQCILIGAIFITSLLFIISEFKLLIYSLPMEKAIKTIKEYSPVLILVVFNVLLLLVIIWADSKYQFSLLN